MAGRFAHIAARVAVLAGSYVTFLLALVVILIWGVSGPLFGFSDTWQLVINTSTTIVTFLMVFLIQNTQNRDALAVHLKLDELIRAMATADDRLITAEDQTDAELAELKAQYAALCDQHEALQRRIGTSAVSGTVQSATEG
jgi:low affinity Fe/Cu permease